MEEKNVEKVNEEVLEDKETVAEKAETASKEAGEAKTEDGSEKKNRKNKKDKIKELEEVTVKLKEQYSIIMVTHTLRQAMRIADYVIFIYLGKIIEVGDAKEVFHNPKHELTKKYLEGAFS